MEGDSVEEMWFSYDKYLNYSSNLIFYVCSSVRMGSDNCTF